MSNSQDETLITPSSKRKFGKDATDWMFLFPDVPKRLMKIFQEGYFIVVFTNQLGIGLDSTGKRQAEFKRKVRDIFDQIKIPVLLMAALREDVYRKPCIGMWDCLLSKYLHPHPVELSNSFFIGDAAGRPAGWKQGRRSDHASTDRKFALNIGLKFLTPEEFFLEEPSFAYAPEGFDPKKSVYLTEALSVHDILAHFGTTQEAILFVGSPASGKTTFYQRHLAPLEYVHINQDTLKTRAKCIAAMVEAIEAGQSVVIDNTHPSIEARDVFLRILSKKNVPTKCFWFQTDPDLALHLNVYRSLTKKTQRLPKLAFIAYKSRFQEPTLSEGFAEIVRIPLKPHFESSQEEKIFTMYLL